MLRDLVKRDFYVSVIDLHPISYSRQGEIVLS